MTDLVWTWGSGVPF